jgi:hypothetical protein
VAGESNSSKLLLDEPPLVIQPALAQQIGLNEAIILQQIHYWICTSPHDREGQKWIYNSYEEWGKQFPWIGNRKLRYVIRNLEQEGYLLTGRFNKRRGDNTKWYRINYEKLEELLDTHLAKLATGVPNHATGVPNFATPLPETTTETTIREEPKSITEQLLLQIQALAYWKNQGDDATWLADFQVEYPEFSLQHLIECRDFWDGRRPRGKGDWKNRLRNWMKKGREFASRRTAAQGETERKRSSIPRDAKQGKYHRFNPPTPAELAEQKRRLDAGLPPVERSRYG